MWENIKWENVFIKGNSKCIPKNSFFTHDVASLLLRNVVPYSALGDNEIMTFCKG